MCIRDSNCGALYPEHLSELVARLRADAGFCYDGDADRLIAVDEKGHVVDGARIICIFADKLKKQGKLTGGLAVGTVHTLSLIHISRIKETRSLA